MIRCILVMMQLRRLLVGILATVAILAQDAVWHHRNLGKAFYENPTTQKEAVEQFRQALQLAPGSAREQLNYGLALLRAGQTERAVELLRKVQKSAPDLPHTWFNLGIALKKQGDLDGALEQFREMAKRVPNLAVVHYQIGALLKAKGDTRNAVGEFESARNADPRLAAPHFQLYGLYRQVERSADAAKELELFQKIRKQNEGAAVPEDMEWCFYSEIYDPPATPAGPPVPAPVYRAQTLARGVAGVVAASLTAGGRAQLIRWSATSVNLSGLETVRDVRMIAPGDFDNDGLTDLAVLTGAGATLYRNTGAGRFRKHADLASGVFRDALWIDIDHDYDLDLILLGGTTKLMRNNGSAGFSDETSRMPFAVGRARRAARLELEPDTPGFDFVVSYEDRPPVLYRDRLGGVYSAGEYKQPVPGSTIAADLDGSGRLSRVHVADGALVLERDVAVPYGNWIEVALIGVKNLKSAVGARVELKAGEVYQKQFYEGIPLVFRFSGSQIDTIRITWPNGLIQNEIRPAVNRILTIKEAPRLSGSCPMIFTWDGAGFRFITDVLGVAPLGASAGDGQYFPVDHDEYVSISSDELRPRHGMYEIRLTEELREVTYLDHVKLIAVDHPANIGIVTNEKFKSPPFPDARLFGIDRPVYPIAARDHLGTPVLTKLLKRDGLFPDSFRRDQAGAAEMHTLDLDFGRAAASNNAVLVLDGWVDWADGSTFLSAAQERKELAFPSLQVKDRTGTWKTVIADMGMPSGRQKRIAVDLTGKFLSASREVRIVTNLCIYWDEIFLVESASEPPVRLTTVPNVSADLHFRGFSGIVVDAERKRPEHFDYNHVTGTAMWNPTPGRYTRYGDVRDLLAASDDRMVIMGSGDELALRFDPASLPPVRNDWTRDYLLYVDGWAKDGDANTAFSQSVLPLPFHGMSSYPYPNGEHFPDDPDHTAYQNRYNTRPALRLIRPLKEVE